MNPWQRPGRGRRISGGLHGSGCRQPGKTSATIWKKAVWTSAGWSDEEVEETAEVFALDDGTYLIVEG